VAVVGLTRTAQLQGRPARLRCERVTRDTDGIWTVMGMGWAVNKLRAIAGWILLGSTAVAHAASWQRVTSGTDGRVLFLDTSSVTRHGGVIKVWVKTDFAAVRSEPARERKALYGIKCAERTWDLLHSSDFDATGRVLNSFTRSRGLEDYTPVVPDTVTEAVMQAVC
jgi:hypothetical protein